jgi:hypothetical protein
MAKTFKDDFITIQTNLRDSPGGTTAGFEVNTRRLAGLLSEAAIRDFSIRIDEPTTLGIPVDAVSVKLTGRLDLRGFFAVDEGVRPGLKDIHATVTIDSPANADDIERLKATVDRHCPVLDILRNVTPVKIEYALLHESAKTAA